MEVNIKIEWDGPYKLSDIGYIETEEKYQYKDSTLDTNKDYGIYQIYGNHPVYGHNVLLYIGKADQQTFSHRLSQEAWEFNEDYKNIKIYVGRLFDEKQPKFNEWSKLIDIAERMLIFSHSPAKNSSNILNISKDKQELKKFENVRVFNYGCYRSLMSEISGELWIKDFTKEESIFVYK